MAPYGRPIPLFLVLATLASAAGGCASAPRYRASVLVRLAGEGEAAWENARDAAKAVTLRQNLKRWIREVRRYRLRMLEAEDPALPLREAVVAKADDRAAKRDARAEVLVRIYGDSSWELRKLCQALVNFWESEGLMGMRRSSGLAGRTRPPERSARDDATALAAARARAEYEEEERRLYQEKQRLLGEQVDLGRQWQGADARVQEQEKVLLSARKEVATQEQEVRRVQGILRKPPRERYRALEDADVQRLHAEVVEAEQALRQAQGLPQEVRDQVSKVLGRKKEALKNAQARILKEAEGRVGDAREKVTAQERALEAVKRERDDIQKKRGELTARLQQAERGIALARDKVKNLREPAPAPKPPTVEPAPADTKVYRLQRIVRRCRVRRLADD
jgi:cation transport regulator ChaB